MAVGDGPEASALEVAVVEANALALGLSVDALMENAGRAIAEEASTHLPAPPARVVILAGIGNNGGDGTCAAYYLGQWGYAPEIWLVRPASEIRGAAARRCWDRASTRFPTHIGVPRPETLQGAALVVDALLGIGLRGEPRGSYAEAIDAIHDAKMPTLSVDVPSGLGTPRAVRPRWTVTLSIRKEGMNAENSGEIRVRDIGIPPEARDRTGPGEFLRAPHREAGPHGRTGRVVVIGGGPFAGAPALAGLAALRAGAERATVIVPSPAAEAVRSSSLDLVVHGVGRDAFAPRDVPQILELLRRFPVQAVIVGMGAGRDPGTTEALGGLIGSMRGRLPLVIDADALPALSVSPAVTGTVVATPNAGEYARWFGADPAERPEDRLESARHRAREWGVTLLAKGSADLITDGRQATLNLHHHPAATVSGVGDLLAGVVGGLLAQGVPPFGAARLATYWVGDAGSKVAEERGFGLIASDVLDALPATLVAGLRRFEA